MSNLKILIIILLIGVAMISINAQTIKTVEDAEGINVAEAYDVDFNPSKTQLFTYNVILRGKLKNTHSDESQRLPIPATYIVGKNGKIIWRQFDHDYKKRSSVKDILKAL